MCVMKNCILCAMSVLAIALSVAEGFAVRVIINVPDAREIND